jgi:hypothetical protein
MKALTAETQAPLVGLNRKVSDADAPKRGAAVTTGLGI